jgi:hypothetical protein
LGTLRQYLSGKPSLIYKQEKGAPALLLFAAFLSAGTTAVLRFGIKCCVGFLTDGTFLFHSNPSFDIEVFEINSLLNNLTLKRKTDKKVRRNPKLRR